MAKPSVDEVRALAGRGKVVPIWTEIPADLETPVSVFLKLRGRGPAFLLESVEKGEQIGRYSFLGVDPSGVLVAEGGAVILHEAGGERRLATEDPLAAAKGILDERRPVAVPGLPHFTGGLVGYLAYDAVRFFERAPLAAKPGLGLPDAILMITDTVIVFDHVRHRLLIVATVALDGNTDAAYADAVARIEGIIAALQAPLLVEETSRVEASPEPTWASNFEQERFEAAVRDAKQEITAGEIFQVVLSQRLSRRTDADPFDIYRTLRMVNPSPYMFYLDLPGELHLLGSSPEMLVRLEEGVAELRPIAGTRSRGADPTEDAGLAEELLADPKERAEHIMLVDLGRNDLGRVCEYGTVHVTEMMEIERYSHVMHIVSSVRGRLRDDADAFDLLRAAFPAGTVSGAPKVRAMEILADLEQERRGPYAGAVGYFGDSGDMDTCIAIRTIVVRGDQVYVQAGAGIVADSDPAREYEETLNKAEALAEAVRLTERAEGMHSVRAPRGGGE